MAGSVSYCIEALLEARSNRTPIDFFIEDEQTSSQAAEGGAGMPDFGTEQTAGLIRICDLHPGSYKISAFQGKDGLRDSLQSLGISNVEISDRDVRNIHLIEQVPLEIAGQVICSSKQSDRAPHATLSLSLTPLGRRYFMGEGSDLEVRAPIPGDFVFRNVLMSDYSIQVGNLPSDLYVKDITYSGTSILHAPLRAGSAARSADVQILLADDGGHVNATVIDKDEKPMWDRYVLILPNDATSEVTLADEIVFGQTDQHGVYRSSVVRHSD
jgi:hypothetical protein